jgi:hypothetical protein
MNTLRERDEAIDGARRTRQFKHSLHADHISSIPSVFRHGGSVCESGGLFIGNGLAFNHARAI